MRCLQIINMPSDGHLGSSNCDIGNAWVIWIDNKRALVGLEVNDKLLVEEEGAFEEAVEGLGQLDVEECLVRLAVDNIFAI